LKNPQKGEERRRKKTAKIKRGLDRNPPGPGEGRQKRGTGKKTGGEIR